jgi:phospholipid/cholesterol/gamma-HCH transport system permease protein
LSIWCGTRAGYACPLVAQMEQVGVDAMPIVGLLSFLIGVVFAYRAPISCAGSAPRSTRSTCSASRSCANWRAVDAIIIAGRSGSAFTAQIGTMQVNEEIDALRTLGLNPIEVLVVPRVLGLVLTCRSSSSTPILWGCWAVVSCPGPRSAF